jgi:formamidopyrimidine-DNA glycosylase
MPELPDIVVYIEALEARIVGHPIERVRLSNPFVLRSVDPPVEETHGKTVTALRRQTGSGFPEQVTAFRDEMAVHGCYRKPCPDCGSAIQRIVYAENETNYCARCQTGGKLLADRAVSRLLREDWPRTLDELEAAHVGTA